MQEQVTKDIIHGHGANRRLQNRPLHGKFADRRER